VQSNGLECFTASNASLFYTAERAIFMKKTKLIPAAIIAAMLLAACAETTAPHTNTPPSVAQDTTAQLATSEVDSPRAEQRNGSGGHNTLNSLEELILETMSITTEITNSTARSVENVGVIVRGRVVGAPEIREWCMVESWTEEMLESLGQAGPPPPIRYTVYNFDVYETFFGERVDRLSFSMLGLPDCNESTIKPNIGDELLMFLWKSADGTYGTLRDNASVFRVNDNGTLYSFSDGEATSRFDGLRLEALTSEINDVLEMSR
jgi:hypothetical protein